MGPFVLSIDQGTTGSTALVLDYRVSTNIRTIGRSTVPFKLYYPETGWVEQDLEDIWHSVKTAVKKACEQAHFYERNFSIDRISSIGITNQRETIAIFDPKSSKPLYNAIVWQCKRSLDLCESLKKDGVEATVREKTGLLLDPYFSGSKIRWLIENRPEVASALKSRTAVVGTVDSFLINRLTGGNSFVTEPSNASRTLLYNLKTGQWDPDLLKLFKIPHEDSLATIKESADSFGVTAELGFIPQGIPINGVLGDQQAALAGQTCFSEAEGKCTYGTGAFLLMNIGDKPIFSKNGLLTTVAWELKGKRTYAFEGSAFIAGASVQYLRDQMQILDHAHESEERASKILAAPEVYFVPALAGLGAPHWKPEARGAFLGLTRGTSNEQLIRASLEGIAFQVNDLIHAMEKDRGQKMTVLRVDGGACANNLLMQTQADLTSIPVDRPENLETTALGAGLFAALGAGIFEDLSELKNARIGDRVFHPQMDSPRRNAMISGWERALAAVKVFSDAST